MLNLDPRDPQIAFLRCPSGADIHLISLNLNLEAFPFFTMFGPLWLYFLFLCVYLMQGRLAGYLPTISETGVESFNHSLQFRFFTWIACTSSFSDLCMALYLCTRTKNPISLFLVFFFIAFGLSGMVGIGCAEMVDHHRTHQVCAVSGTLLLIFLQFAICLILVPYTSLFLQIRRFLYVILQLLSFCLMAFSEFIFPARYSITISTSGEYVMSFFMVLFTFTFGWELREHQMVLFYADQPEPPAAHMG
jgi:hypothetical protein